MSEVNDSIKLQTEIRQKTWNLWKVSKIEPLIFNCMQSYNMLKLCHQMQRCTKPTYVLSNTITLSNPGKKRSFYCIIIAWVTKDTFWKVNQRVSFVREALCSTNGSIIHKVLDSEYTLSVAFICCASWLRIKNQRNFCVFGAHQLGAWVPSTLYFFLCNKPMQDDNSP